MNEEISPNDWYKLEQKYLTPSPEKQIQYILEGLCPHNQGWAFYAYYHNTSCFKCKKCGVINFY